MSSMIADIRDAVVTALNAARVAETLSLDFDIAAKYVPASKESELEDLTITVVPLAAELTQQQRGRKQREQPIGILIQQKIASTSDPESAVASVNANTNEEIDALVQFGEEVSEMWSPALLGTTGANWARTEHKAIYDVQKLRELRIFESIVVVYFKYER